MHAGNYAECVPLLADALIDYNKAQRQARPSGVDWLVGNLEHLAAMGCMYGKNRTDCICPYCGARGALVRYRADEATG